MMIVCVLLLVMPFTCALQSTSDSKGEVIRLSKEALRASAIKTTEPIYPPLAKAAWVYGKVSVEVVVAEDGRVISGKSISGHPLLRSAAETAATGWTFQPAIVGNEPVKVKGVLVLKFEIKDSEIEEIKAKLSDHPNETYRYGQLAHAYVTQERYEEAIAVYEERISSDTADSGWHYELGRIYLEMGKYEEAAGELRVSAGLDPLSSAAWRELGIAEEKAGHYEAAIQAYQESIKAREGPEVMYELGKLYNKLGRYDRALEVLEKAAEYTDRWKELHFELGLAYAKTDNGKKARREYEKLKELGSPLAEELLSSITGRSRSR